MTALQLAAIIGLLFSSATVMFLWWVLPARPNLAHAVAHLSGNSTQGLSGARFDPTGASRIDKLGHWSMRSFPTFVWGSTSAKDLSLLQIPMHRHYGTKLLYALIGLVFPLVLGIMCHVLGLMPFYLPAIVGPVLALVMFVVPDSNVKQEAATARETFKDALISFIDMVALARLTGSSAREALSDVAEVGDNWVFTRIDQAVSLSTWNRQMPWTALRVLADEVQVPELADFADILSRESDGSQLVAMLQAKSQSLRDTRTQSAKAEANKLAERFGMPAVVLFGAYVLTLATPFVSNIAAVG